jgi:hypothetical protein
MTFEIDDSLVARVSALPVVMDAAKVGVSLISLWPLQNAQQLENDADYAEGLQVRFSMLMARAMLRNSSKVTMAAAEAVYDGMEVIPGCPLWVVNALLEANDAYDCMSEYSATGDIHLVFKAADYLNIVLGDKARTAMEEVLGTVAAEVAKKALGSGAMASDDAANGSDFDAVAAAEACLSTSTNADEVAVRFASALVICDKLMNIMCEDFDDVNDQAIRVLPVLLYVNELREQFSVPRIFMTHPQLLELLSLRRTAHMIDDSGAASAIGNSLGTLGVTAQFVGMLAAQEWAYHRREILWDPEEAKRKAKEEDERKSKEALAEKFKHVKDDPDKPQIDL